MSDFMTVDTALAERLALRSVGPSVARTTERIAIRARTLAPGTMKTKIRTNITFGGIPLGIIVCDHPATQYVLFGTKPHTIKPRNANVLRFQVGGSTVFSKIVHHPGTKPNNFLRKALEESRIL